MDEAICPLDFRQAGLIIDDDLHTLLVKPLPAGVRLTALMVRLKVCPFLSKEIY